MYKENVDRYLFNDSYAVAEDFGNNLQTFSRSTWLEMINFTVLNGYLPT